MLPSHWVGSSGSPVAVGARDEVGREEAVGSSAPQAPARPQSPSTSPATTASLRLTATIEQLSGRLDVLVDDAAISGRADGRAQDPTALDLDVLRTVWRQRRSGVIPVTNSMLPLPRRADPRRIVDMSSGTGS